MIEDIIKDIKEIKSEVVGIRIDIEKSKTGARIAWIAFTFFIGISGYFFRDYVGENIEKINQQQVVISQLKQDVALATNRIEHLENKQNERDYKRVYYQAAN